MEPELAQIPAVGSPSAISSRLLSIPWLRASFSGETILRHRMFQSDSPVGPDMPRFLRREQALVMVVARSGFLGSVTLFGATPLVFAIAWTRAGTVGPGLESAALTAALGFIFYFVMAVVLTVVLIIASGLGQNPAKVERELRERWDYQAAHKEFNAARARGETPVLNNRDDLARLARALPIAHTHNPSEFLPSIRRLLGKEELRYLAQGHFGTAVGLVAVTRTRLISDFGFPRIVPLSSIQQVSRDGAGSVHLVSAFEEFTFSIVSGGSWDQLLEVVEAGRTAPEPLAS